MSKDKKVDVSPLVEKIQIQKDELDQKLLELKEKYDAAKSEYDKAAARSDKFGKIIGSLTDGKIEDLAELIDMASDTPPREQVAKIKKQKLPVFDLTTGTGDKKKAKNDLVKKAVSFIKKSTPAKKADILKELGFDKSTHRIPAADLDVFKKAITAGGQIEITGDKAATRFEVVSKK